jgi:hypothetical protein
MLARRGHRVPGVYKIDKQRAMLTTRGMRRCGPRAGLAVLRSGAGRCFSLVLARLDSMATRRLRRVCYEASSVTTVECPSRHAREAPTATTLATWAAHA